MREEVIQTRNIEKVIPLGQKVMIYVEGGNFEGTYSSYIYDMNENYIYIAMPTNEKGLKAVVRESGKLSVSFVDRRGARIGFHSTVVSIERRNGNILYKLEKPSQIVKMELRESFRVEALIECEFFYFKNGKINKARGTIIDISAGGVRLSCDVDLEVRDKLFLKFTLNNHTLEQIEAEVVRKGITGDRDIKHYGLQFKNLDKNSENHIIKFCLKRQLEMARKMRGLE